MSYMLTRVRIYGVTLTYEEAKRALDITGELGFLAESENAFKALQGDFGPVDPFDMKSYYDDLKMDLAPSYPYHQIQTLGEFFDYFGFPKYHVAAGDRQTIPSSFDERRGIQYYRLRYYADLFCHDADSRGDSLRSMPDRESSYGIYIASDGYAYRDDLRSFESDPSIKANFDRYCRPVLDSLGTTKTPAIMDVWQTW